jgi:hypothetical protein
MQVSLILYNLNAKLPLTWSSSLNSRWYYKTNHHLHKNIKTKEIKNERRNEKEKPQAQETTWEAKLNLEEFTTI